MNEEQVAALTRIRESLAPLAEAGAAHTKDELAMIDDLMDTMTAMIDTLKTLRRAPRPAPTQEGVPVPNASTTATQEAHANGSVEERLSKISRAWEQRAEQTPQATPAYPGGYVSATFDDHLIIKNGEQCMKVPYTMAEDGTVTFGDPIEVTMVYEPVAEAALTESISDGQLLESKTHDGSVWRVRIIRPGFSKNPSEASRLPRYYPIQTLQVAAPLFEGVAAYAHPGGQHVRSIAERSATGKVGWYANVAYDGGITADLHLVDVNLRTKLTEAFKHGKKDFLGLSIDGFGKEEVGIAEGVKAAIVTALTKINSTDVVPDPAAGGEFVRLVAAQGDDTMPTGALLTLARELRPDRIAAKPDTEWTDVDLQAIIKEAATQAPQTTGQPTADAMTAKFAEIERKAREREVREAIAAHPIAQHEPAKAKMLGMVSDLITKSDAQIKEALDSELAYLAKVGGTGKVVGLGESASVTQDEKDTLQKAMDGMFERRNIDNVPRFRSLKEAFARITGRSYWDINPSMMLQESARYVPETQYGMPFRESIDGRRVTESVGTSTWAELLGDSITRKMVKEYSLEELSIWRKIVSDVSSVTDFRTQRRMRMGGYGTLPTVGQSGTYNPLTSPTDEEATYSVSKRGGLEDLTFEAIANDDVGAVSRIPVKLGRAAAQTLYRFVFDFLRNGFSTTIYDGNNLFDATNHGSNTAANALSKANLDTAIQVMRTQTAYGDTSETLGGVNAPKYLIVPNELEDLAYRLATSLVLQGATGNAATEPSYLLKYKLEPLVVDYWTDATDWFAVADPAKMPTIEIGFFNGQEQPELFVQDQPTVGSNFTADKVTWKIRHIYGGAILDFRPFYGANS